MRRVTKEEFFKVVGNQNVHPQIQPGGYPYTSLWKLLGSADNRRVIGKTVGVGDPLGKKEYFLAE